MGIFVASKGVPARVGENTVYVRVDSFTFKEAQVLAKLGQAVADGDADAMDKLLSTVIVRWEGPDFEGVPCDAEHIGKLNVRDPMFQEVLRVIQESLSSPKG